MNKLTLKKSFPLVSCIMPTARRPQFVEQAVAYFRRQDYPNKELIIIADAHSDIPDTVECTSDISIYILNPTNSIGGKRNYACRMAKGEVIIHWDDDDWYYENRISKQIEPILDGKAEICAVTRPLFFSIHDLKFWKISEALNQRMFVNGVMGGSLAFLQGVWRKGVRYPNTSLREDIDFLQRALKRGSKLELVEAKDLYIYVRHNNTWKFNTGNFIDSNEWSQVEIPVSLSTEDFKFYESLRINQSNRTLQLRNLEDQSNERTMVSCIMPTADRPDYVRKSIIQFLKQDYLNKELIIVDDGTVPFPIGNLKRHPLIQYIRLNKHHSIGAKRNMACENAKGDIILHWDDDDWYASDWINLQVNALEVNKADITGLDTINFIDLIRNKAWTYEYPRKNNSWVHGATLAYRKDFWRGNPFEDISVGEDVKFLWSIRPKKIYAHEGYQSYIGLVHHKNTSKKQVESACWTEISIDKVIYLSSGYFDSNLSLVV